MNPEWKDKLIDLSKRNRLFCILKPDPRPLIISDKVYKETVIAGKIKGAQDALIIELFLTQNKWNPVEVNTKEIGPWGKNKGDNK